MYTEKRIKIKSFHRTKNPNRNGSYCAFSDKHFIDYMQECYAGPYNIIICESCKGEGVRDNSLKYHNIPNEYDGYIYSSTFEANYAKNLDLRKKVGEIKDWKRQVKIPINIKFENELPVLTDEPELELKKRGISFYHICNYFIDFVVTHNDNSLEYTEVKGMELPLWKMKFTLTEAIFKNRVKLTVIKQQGIKLKKQNRKITQ